MNKVLNEVIDLSPDAQLSMSGMPQTSFLDPEYTESHDRRILIVDDDPLLIRALRDTLEDDGHSVIAAPGGQEGIDAFEKAHRNRKPFSLVITDLGMPHVDGRKVSAAIKALSPRTPVILFTGWGQRLIAERDLPEHVDRVLNKPPKLQDLRVALAELTARNGSRNS